MHALLTQNVEVLRYLADVQEKTTPLHILESQFLHVLKYKLFPI